MSIRELNDLIAPYIIIIFLNNLQFISECLVYCESEYILHVLLPFKKHCICRRNAVSTLLFKMA